MKTCLVTCGPSSTRIDDVRRITNFSTGELGTLLTESLRAAGHEVICLRGEGATFRKPTQGRCESFFSNADLMALLENHSQAPSPSNIFHAAALADFEVSTITSANGVPLLETKISSSMPELTIRMRPAEKVIKRLRRMYPAAHITGWKYELDGTKAEIIEKAFHQIASNLTDACVINGAAYGSGFGWITPHEQQHFADKATLIAFLQKIVTG